MSNTNFLPSWTIGGDAYQEVYNVVRRYGKTAVIIGGKTALEKAAHLITDAFEGKDFEVLKTTWYGGDATYENAQMLEDMEEVQKADMIFGVGGGRAIDLCKLVAQHLDKPLFSFPTIASNCAACTSIGVFYHADGSFKGYEHSDSCPSHCFINSQVIAESPSEYFWAGIGDGLSKEYEVEFAMRADEVQHTTLLGINLAHACTDPLIEFGQQAMEQCKNNEVGTALEEVALAILISTGLVSNCTAHPTDYYYNSSLAHAIYNGSTLIENCGHKHLHGEIVSYGVLCLLQYDNNMEQLERIMKFNHSLKLPITLEEIGLVEKDLQVIADKASTLLEWTKAPYEITKEKFIQSMLDVDVLGKVYHKAQVKL